MTASINLFILVCHCIYITIINSLTCLPVCSHNAWKSTTNKGKSIQTFMKYFFKKETFCVNLFQNSTSAALHRLYADPTPAPHRLYADYTEQNIENRQQFSYSVTVLNDKYFPAGLRQSLAKRHCEKSYCHSIASISHGNMLGHLSADITCSQKRTVFRENTGEENCELWGTAMSRDKYPSIFSR